MCSITLCSVSSFFWLGFDWVSLRQAIRKSLLPPFPRVGISGAVSPLAQGEPSAARALPATCTVPSVKVHHHFKVSDEEQPLSPQQDPQVLAWVVGDRHPFIVDLKMEGCGCGACSWATPPLPALLSTPCCSSRVFSTPELETSPFVPQFLPCRDSKDGSVGRGSCHSPRGPESEFQDPHGTRREQTPPSCPLRPPHVQNGTRLPIRAHM